MGCGSPDRSSCARREGAEAAASRHVPYLIGSPLQVTCPGGAGASAQARGAHTRQSTSQPGQVGTKVALDKTLCVCQAPNRHRESATPQSRGVHTQGSRRPCPSPSDVPGPLGISKDEDSVPFERGREWPPPGGVQAQLLPRGGCLLDKVAGATGKKRVTTSKPQTQHTDSIAAWGL